MLKCDDQCVLTLIYIVISLELGTSLDFRPLKTQRFGGETHCTTLQIHAISTFVVEGEGGVNSVCHATVPIEWHSQSSVGIASGTAIYRVSNIPVNINERTPA